MRQTKRRITRKRNTRKRSLRNTRKRNTRKRNTRKRNVRNTKKRLFKGGLTKNEILDQLIRLIEKNQRINVDAISLYNPRRISQPIASNNINKIMSILDEAYDENTHAQMFSGDEENEFKAVLFNQLFKRLNKIVTRMPTNGQLDAMGNDHSDNTIELIKESGFISDLDKYGYIDEDNFTDEFKDVFISKPTTRLELEEDPNSDEYKAKYPIYLAEGEKPL